MGYSRENYTCLSMAGLPRSPKRHVISTQSNSPTILVADGKHSRNYMRQTHVSDFSKFLYLINNERFNLNISPLRITDELSQLSLHHAQWMADNGSVRNASGIVLHLSRTSNKVGQNVGWAPSCEEVHLHMMSLAGDRSRIVDLGYTEVGVGTARGSDGSVFVCELFRT